MLRKIEKFFNLIFRFLAISNGIKIAYWLILIFFSPLIIIIPSLLPTTITSQLFGDKIDIFPEIMGRMSIGFSGFRDAYGSVIIPLITAYSIELSPNSREIPQRIQRFLLFLLIWLLISTLSNGMVHANQDRLQQEFPDFTKKTGKTLYNTLEETTSTAVKQSLTYIALTIGISLKSH